MTRLLRFCILALFAATAAAAAPVVYTRHATERLAERHIEKAWVARVIEHPESIEPDKQNAKVQSAYGCIGERGLVLHVVYTDVKDGHLVITEYFDAKAERRGFSKPCAR